MREHEKEVVDALYKYWNKVLEESGHLDTVLEMGKMRVDGEANRWLFEVAELSGTFVFTHKDFEVYATPYYECAEGLAYAIYEDGEIITEGTIPLITTGNSPNDTDNYIGMIDDLMETYRL